MIFDLITFLIYGIIFLGVIAAAYYSYKSYCVLVEIKKELSERRQKTIELEKL